MDQLPSPHEQARSVFAERLRMLRLRRLLSQEALAAEVGLSATTVGLYEHAQREPQLSTLVRLAEALRVTPAYLLGTDQDEAEPALGELFEELRHARAEQVEMVRAFWAYLKRKERGFMDPLPAATPTTRASAGSGVRKESRAWREYA